MLPHVNYYRSVVTLPIHILLSNRTRRIYHIYLLVNAYYEGRFFGHMLYTNIHLKGSCIFMYTYAFS